MKLITIAFSIALLSATHFCVNAQPARQISILADKPTVDVPPNMWGIFFEDINFSADGGLYAELVKNRSFEFATPLMGWKELKKNATGKVLVINRSGANINNPRFARITVDAATDGYFGLVNEGFRGMGVQKDEQYNFSVLLNAGSSKALKLQLRLVNAKGDIIGTAAINNIAGGWKKYTASFKATETEAKASLQVLFEGKGTADIDMVSLFPQHTWKERPNGLRKDLVEKLAELKPGFIRFPGGCIVEGRDLLNRYDWKKTVGPVEDRKLIMNRWNVEFPKAAAPDYFQTFGLGFFEYFQLCDDLGATPLPILNCGMACQYNSKEVVSLTELDPFIQDALDLIEFANGAITTKWGKLRASMGHPAPFNLKLLGVGNEQWDEQYAERYKAFQKVLKQRYPKISLIAAAGPKPNGSEFDYAWKELSPIADFMDEHYYSSGEWFLKNATRYDNYDRKKAKVFAGEYAMHGADNKEPESKNSWYSALCEAAFMTGLERNADIVQMASYAPLMAHVNAWQWRPDLIWFDNLKSIATPNYYVQKMYANYKGTMVLPTLMDGKIMAGADSLYASTVIDKKANKVYIKIANTSAEGKPVVFNLKGIAAKPNAIAEVISSADVKAFNSIENSNAVVPAKEAVRIIDNGLQMTLKGYSFTVIAVDL